MKKIEMNPNRSNMVGDFVVYARNGQDVKDAIQYARRFSGVGDMFDITIEKSSFLSKDNYILVPVFKDYTIEKHHDEMMEIHTLAYQTVSAYVSVSNKFRKKRNKT